MFWIAAATTIGAGSLLAGTGTAEALPLGVTCTGQLCINNSDTDQFFLAQGLCPSGGLATFVAYAPAHGIGYLAPITPCPKSALPGPPILYF